MHIQKTVFSLLFENDKLAVVPGSYTKLTRLTFYEMIKTSIKLKQLNFMSCNFWG